MVSFCLGQQQSPQPAANGGKTSIRGTVTDPQNAVVAGAKLVLQGGSVKREAETGADGAFSFTDLSPGTYNLTVSAADFAQKVFSDIALTEGLEINLDVQLELPSATEQVNVESSNAGRVETESATLSGTIAQKEVQTLQLVGITGRNRRLSTLCQLRKWVPHPFAFFAKYGNHGPEP